jgi:hypothetical protein
MPSGGLERGALCVVRNAPGASGAGSLAVALAAAASSSGCWVAATGHGCPGALAAAELGVELGRFIFVPSPGALVIEAAAMLVEAVDILLLWHPRGTAPVQARRLAARAGERGCALVVLEGPKQWPERPAVTLTVAASRWEGPARGHGHLRARVATVVASTRGLAERATRHVLMLPGPSGRVESGEQVAAVAPGIGVPGIGPHGNPASGDVERAKRVANGETEGA